jgi:hypothetical protein
MAERQNLAAENLAAEKWGAIGPLLIGLSRCDQLRISLNLELH